MNLQIDSKLLEDEVPILGINEVLQLDWDDFGRLVNLEVQGYGPRMSAKKPLPPKEPLRDYWSSVKKEVFLLLCTKDRKYSKIRSQISRKGKSATLYVLSAISAWLATVIGAPLAMLTPLVAALLLAISKVGLNAWCSLKS